MEKIVKKLTTLILCLTVAAASVPLDVHASGVINAGAGAAGIIGAETAKTDEDSFTVDNATTGTYEATDLIENGSEGTDAIGADGSKMSDKTGTSTDGETEESDAINTVAAEPDEIGTDETAESDPFNTVAAESDEIGTDETAESDTSGADGSEESDAINTGSETPDMTETSTAGENIEPDPDGIRTAGETATSGESGSAIDGTIDESDDVSTDLIAVENIGQPDNDDLFEAYLQEKIDEEIAESSEDASDPETKEQTPASRYNNNGASLRALRASVPRADSLSEVNRYIYDDLRTRCAQVAAGKLYSTQMVVSIPMSEIMEAKYGKGKYRFTAEELGVEQLVNPGETDSSGAPKVNEAARAALIAKTGYDADKVVQALLFDMPYEMYWFDKVSGYVKSGLTITRFSVGGEVKYLGFSLNKDYDVQIRLAVAQAYSDGQWTHVAGTINKDYLFGTDQAKTGAVITTIDTVKSIVYEHASETDYCKLQSYKEYICDAVSYNSEAWNDPDYEGGYGDPWQLIYVFDGDPETNVVCEGYSKAFKILCDLTHFDSELIACYIMTGKLNGTGSQNGHMWNMVVMEDGGRYLVDVTNCDGALNSNRLFLVGTVNSSSGAEGEPPYLYIFSNGGTSRFIYNNDSLAAYTAEELTLSTQSYNPEFAWVSAPEPNISAAEAASVSSGTRLALSTATPGASIRYTTDGTAPDTDSALYEDAIVLDESIATGGQITVSAVAYKADRRSAVATFEYTLTDEQSFWGTLSDAAKAELTAKAEEQIGPDATEQDAIALIPNGIWISGVPEALEYTGQALKIENLEVYFGKTLLSAGTDYGVSYKNNKSANNASVRKKAPTVTVTARGNYSGTASETFAIRPLMLGTMDPGGVITNSDHVTAPDVTLPYVKSGMVKGTTSVYYAFARGESEEAGYRYVKLKPGTDYRLIYPTGDSSPYAGYVSDHHSPGDHAVIIVGRGNYTGTAVFTETILERASDIRSLSKLKIKSIPAQIMSDTGASITPGVKVYDGRKKLSEGTDYILSYIDNDAPGTAYAIIMGIGDYAGSRTVAFKIKGKSIAKATVRSNGYTDFLPLTYTGMPCTYDNLSVYVSLGDGYQSRLLTEGRDYTVKYSNNVKVGKATLQITGCGGYSGTWKKKIKIISRPLFSEEILISGANSCPGDMPAGESAGNVTDDSFRYTADLGRFCYTKSKTMPKPVVRYDNTSSGGSGIILKEGRDYTLTYSNCGKQTVAGTKTYPAVKIRGKGNYAGTISRTYTIIPGRLDYVKMSASNIKYGNRPGLCKPRLTLKDTNGKKLVSKTDYDPESVIYTYEDTGEEVDMDEDIILPGTQLRATVSGIGNYAGSSRSASFKFITGDISGARISIRNMTYTGRPIVITRADVRTIELNKTKLDPGDYVIDMSTIKNNTNCGYGTVVIRGRGVMGGAQTVKFKIVPAK